jgi:hypothetical protein
MINMMKVENLHSCVLISWLNLGKFCLMGEKADNSRKGFNDFMIHFQAALKDQY